MDVMQAIKRLVANPDFYHKCHEMNEPLYFKSFLEDDCLYHTTPWHRMKCILRDGFLTSNEEHLKKRKVHSLHKRMICFTTSPWRHLSNMPDFVTMLGDVSMDCYLKFPFEALKSLGVKPVVYQVTIHDLEDLAEAGHYYYFATLTHRRDKLLAEYGEDFEDYRYMRWYSENEWRIKADKLNLPSCTEVYVSSYYQRRVARQLTDLPVKIDYDLMKFKNLVKSMFKLKKRE